MKAFLISVTAACMLFCLTDVFLPDGKIKKYLSGILKVAIVFFSCLPLLTFFSDKNIEEITVFEQNEQNLSVFQQDRSFYASLIERELRSNGVPCDVFITVEEGGETYVDIFAEQTVINETEGNIYKNSKAVIDAVERFFPVERERIRVWAK